MPTIKEMVKVVVITVALVIATPAYAHPGRTAGDGCHYCRTNCSSWGEVAGARHCHGGGAIAPPPAQDIVQEPVEDKKVVPVESKEVVPVEIKKVVPVESKAVKVVAPPPTQTKEPAVLGIEEEVMLLPTPTPSPTLISSPTSKVIKKPAPTPEPEEEAGSGVLWLLGLLIAGGGFYLYKRRGSAS